MRTKALPTILFVALVALFIGYTAAHAEEGSMLVQGVTFRIGMTEDEVVRLADELSYGITRNSEGISIAPETEVYDYRETLRFYFDDNNRVMQIINGTTSKGLSVGDDITKMRALYGVEALWETRANYDTYHFFHYDLGDSTLWARVYFRNVKIDDYQYLIRDTTSSEYIIDEIGISKKDTPFLYEEWTAPDSAISIYDSTENDDIAIAALVRIPFTTEYGYCSYLQGQNETVDGNTVTAYSIDGEKYFVMKRNENEGIDKIYCDNEKLASSRGVFYGDTIEMIERLYGLNYSVLPGNEHCDSIISIQLLECVAEFWLTDGKVTAHTTFWK